MSNYPPGVTGREFAINGWDEEISSEEMCEDCGEVRDGYTLVYDGEALWRCNKCDWESDSWDIAADREADWADSERSFRLDI